MSRTVADPGAIFTFKIQNFFCAGHGPLPDPTPLCPLNSPLLDNTFGSAIGPE